MAIVWQLGPSSASAVTLGPEWTLKDEAKQKRTDARTHDGTLYIRRWYTYDSLKVPVKYVPASDYSVINSWWSTNTQLLLFISNSGTTDVRTVYITNDSRPLPSYSNPYDDHYDGVIELSGAKSR